MPNLTLSFLYMEREHVGKDVTCVPQYLGRMLGADVEIVSLTSATNRDFPAELDGIRYRFLFRRGDRRNGWYKYAFFWWYLIRNAKRIDILMRFHYSVPTMIETILYKMCNPRGKVYIKCDTDHHIISKFPPPEKITDRWKLRLYERGIACIDVISCETENAYEAMSASSSPYFALGDKLVYVPNGFDERLLERLELAPRSAERKENLIVTVGRLGTEEKNTEMLLDALGRIDLRRGGGWKCCLIGSSEPSFRAAIDRFYELHPDKREAVVFTGPIYDKRALWDYYDRSKVFVLTSRWESYGLVLNEAKRFGCYLVSTDVGAARDLIGGRYGEYVPQEDAAALAEVLQRIIDGERNTDVYRGWDASEIYWESVLRPVAERLK